MQFKSKRKTLATWLYRERLLSLSLQCSGIIKTEQKDDENPNGDKTLCRLESLCELRGGG